MGGDTAVDYTTDMQTIRDYVDSVIETRTKLATGYLAALDNFQTTVQTASAEEAKPDLVGTVLKSALKTMEKEAVAAVKESTGADVGPVVEMVHAVYDEVDRAAKAAENRAAGEWIKDLRTSLSDSFTQSQTGEDMRKQLESEYNNNDEGGRGGYIGDIENQLAALRPVQVPPSARLEVSMYESWINQNFNDDCMDGTGIIQLQFTDDGTPDTAKVVAPLGDKIASAINSRMVDANVSQLMDLDVVKKVCRGDSCMCFEGDNTVRKAVLDDDTSTFLSSPDNWKQLSSFKS